MEKTLYLSRVDPATAALFLRGSEALDPSGCTAPGDVARMAENGQCFAATSDKAQAVYVVSVLNGTAWVEACKGFGRADWSGLLFPVIEQQSAGCRAVAFQTARPGLVRRAQRQGYTVAGWILKKEMQ